MARKKSNPEFSTEGPGMKESEMAPRELVVVAKQGVEMRSAHTTVSSLAGADVSDLDKLLSEDVTLEPLFGDSEERLKQEQATMAAEAEEMPEFAGEIPDLSIYYKVSAPDDQLDDLAAKMSKCASVDSAYVKPPTMHAQEIAEQAPPEEAAEIINMMASLEAEAPTITPNFTARQGYLNAAPAGIDAYYAASLAGGRGLGVGIIDIEGGWNFNHEDLRVNQGGVVGGTPTTNSAWVNHGTAVIGVLSGDVNNYGITGICPDARIRGVSIFGLGTAAAIRRAAQLSRRGDVVLIELHRPGPRYNFTAPYGQRGYIAIEWWPDDFAAIRYATVRGVIVVSAAGNGSENLDDPLYNTRPAGFPVTWRNPFNRRLADSGSVIAGAGAPPPGTHGNNHGPDRSRLAFSNYGSVLDAQGWGREVTTTGYGDLQGGSSQDLWYTDRFSGTSSASPIVVGAIACVQGVLKARSRPVMSPMRARDLLRRTGSPQTSAAGRPRTQRIGNRPNLRQLIPAALYVKEWIGVQFNGTLPANATRTWFTYGWPEHWHMLWNVVPTTPKRGQPQIDFDVKVERASDRHITYWITVSNLTNQETQIEGRYAVLGW